MTQETSIKRLREMYLKGIIAHEGGKLVRRTPRRDWAEAFRVLVSEAGGSSVITNNTIIAMLPEMALQDITADPGKHSNAGRPKTGRKRPTWGSTFGKDTRPLAEAGAVVLGISWSKFVDQAVREKAERDGVSLIVV